VKRLVLAALVAAALAAGSAGAATSRDAQLRPGVAIGPIRVGMTFAQVRRALGRPEAVLERRRIGFGTHYTEYAWGGSDWIVAVSGRADRARVVAVATGLRRERTRRGIGVGSTDTAVRRHLGARCYGQIGRHDHMAGRDTAWCILGRSRQRPHTVFALIQECRIPTPWPVKCPVEQQVYRVYEVRVGEPRYIWGLSYGGGG
jgi:hypothetical protein